MSRSTVTGIESHQHHFIGWLENLKRGALYFILHPFFPFRQTDDFNLNCLFSRQTHCCSVNRCGRDITEQDSNHIRHLNETVTLQGYASLLKDHVNRILDRTNATSLANHAVHRFYQRTISAEDSRWDNITKIAKLSYSKLLSIQLILCTIVLSYHLILDIKFVLRYLRVRWRNKVS